LPKAQRAASYRDDPPLLICSPRIDWMNDKEVLDYEMPEYLVTSPKLVCFAHGAAGEYWCFVPDWAEGDSVPVAFLEVDDDDARLVAPNFEGMVFRELLESLSQWSSWVNGFCKLGVKAGELVEFARKIVDTSKPYLQVSQLAALESILAQPLDEKGAFLSPTRARALAREILDYARHDQKFVSHAE
jgi:hypothetical protein